jgi:hypothetical protein
MSRLTQMVLLLASEPAESRVDLLALVARSSIDMGLL